ncbi:hypothetical protein [Nocardia thraciensis]
MSHRNIHARNALAAAAFVATALSMSYQAAQAQPVRIGQGAQIPSVATSYDPCGANQYGCYSPYGACDNYQPGCAGPYDNGYKPYDYDQNKDQYGRQYR